MDESIFEHNKLTNVYLRLMLTRITILSLLINCISTVMLLFTVMWHMIMRIEQKSVLSNEISAHGLTQLGAVNTIQSSTLIIKVMNLW